MSHEARAAVEIVTGRNGPRPGSPMQSPSAGRSARNHADKAPVSGTTTRAGTDKVAAARCTHFARNGNGTAMAVPSAVSAQVACMLASITSQGGGCGNCTGSGADPSTIGIAASVSTRRAVRRSIAGPSIRPSRRRDRPCGNGTSAGQLVTSRRALWNESWAVSDTPCSVARSAAG